MLNILAFLYIRHSLVSNQYIAHNYFELPIEIYLYISAKHKLERRLDMYLIESTSTFFTISICIGKKVRRTWNCTTSTSSCSWPTRYSIELFQTKAT